MTRKDYVLIAGVLAHFGRAARFGNDVLAAHAIAAKFADRLAQENPAFDRVKFLAACLPVTEGVAI